MEFFYGIKEFSTLAHVAGVIFGMGGALISDIFFGFFSRDKYLSNSELSTLTLLRKIVFWALWLIAITGVLMFLSDPSYYLGSGKFLAKMSILVVLIINGIVLNKHIWPHLLDKGFFTSDKKRIIRKRAFVSGAISVVSWIVVFILGSFRKLPFDYGEIFLMYFGLLLIAVLTALFIEKRELN